MANSTLLEKANGALKAGVPTRAKVNRAKKRKLQGKPAVKKKTKKGNNYGVRGKLPKDLSGEVIIPFEAKKISPHCLKCKQKCKQRLPVIPVLCNFEPIVPRKKRSVN